MLYKVVLYLKSMNKTVVCDHSNAESFGVERFHVVMLILLYKVVLTLNCKSMDKILAYTTYNNCQVINYTHLTCTLHALSTNTTRRLHAF